MRVKVVPVSYDGTGWDEVAEGSQDFFATYYHANHKGYGEGWMPLFDFQTGTKADAYNHMYRSKDDALCAANNFSEKVS